MKERILKWMAIALAFIIGLLLGMFGLTPIEGLIVLILIVLLCWCSVIFGMKQIKEMK